MPARVRSGPGGLVAAAALLLFTPLMTACGIIGSGASDPATGSASSYVGRDRCATCHATVAASYAATGMGRSFYLLTPETEIEDFEVENRLSLPELGVLYEMTRRDGEYRIRQSVLDGNGAVLAELERPIDYVVGSGNHARSYLTRENGRLYQMPICWYPDKPGWDLCPGYDLDNKFFTRKVDDACLACHNAPMPQQPAGSGIYLEKIPHGIDCERCHGPGAEHVALWESGVDAPEDDATIVNPGNLPPGRRMQICMQCHLGDAEATERVAEAGNGARDFRPGGHLEEFLDVLSVRPPRKNRFGLSSQADRLVLSRCFQESGGALDCLVCHNPHISVYADDRPADHFRGACLTCHQTGSCQLPEAGRRKASPSDDCTTCHMRKAEPADQRFTLFTDHWIRRKIDPPSAPEIPEGEVRLARVLPEFEPADPAREALNLGNAYLTKKTSSVFGKGIPWELAESHLRKAVSLDSDLAEGWVLLGKVAMRRGNFSQAIGDFREALKIDPEVANVRRYLGTSLLNQGRAAEALEHLEAELDRRPEDVELMNEVGRAHVMLEQEQAARKKFDEALGIEAANPKVLANAGMLEARQGRYPEAARWLRKAGAADPSSPEIWNALAQALVDSGDAGTQEALGAARHAVKLAPAMADARLTLGKTLLAAEKNAEALEEVRIALKIQPSNAEARELMDSLEQRLPDLLNVSLPG